MTKLTEREIKMLFIGGGFIISVLLFYGFLTLRKSFDNIREKKSNLLYERKMIQDAGQEYKLLQALASSVGKQSSNKDIVPDIEILLERNGLKDKAFSISPSKRVIENKYMKNLVSISFKEVTAKDILSFVKDVEEYKQAFLKVDYFRSRPLYRKKGLYNCTIKVATFFRKKEAVKK